MKGSVLGFMLAGSIASTLALAGCADEADERRGAAADTGTPDAATPGDTAPEPDTPEEACTPEEAPDPAGLPQSFTISDTDIEVEVRRAPLSYTVKDSRSALVLESLGSGGGEGYGSVGWAGGEINWRPGISPGYFGFEARLDLWRDDWVVVAAEATDRRVELVLQGPDPSAQDCLPLRVALTFEVRPQTLRVEASLSDEVRPRAWAAAFETPAEEGFLGFGERFNRTNQRGLDIYSFAEEGGIGTGEGDLPGPRNPIPNGEAMTNYPVPFFISTQGYGFWLDSTWYNTFNLATEREDAWRVWHIGPQLAYEVYVPISQDPRPWPYHLIERFTDTVGKAMLPPAWTFGPRRRINRLDRQGEVHELQAMRDLDLAITSADDANHILPMASHIGREEEMRQFIDLGTALGYRLNCYYNSLLAKDEESPIHDDYLEAVEKGYFVLNEAGTPSEVFLISGELVIVSMVDFTSPEATAWFQDTFMGIGRSLGYSGWMYDFGEYVQPTDIGANGMVGEELHNLYPVLYQKAAYDLLEAGPHAGDWLSFARSGYTGAWQYTPMVWSGDPAASFESSDGLPSMVRAGVNLGISGAPHWGGDIGGFHCISDGFEAADEELLTRWIQQGSMSSNMQEQDACVQGGGRKASIFSAPAAMDAWRRYARLHTRLFPYLYTMAHAATRTGEPTMRHLFLEHPDEPRLASQDGSYYFGPALLVAPVLDRGATAKRIALPRGLYLLWDEARVVEGGGDIEVDAPLERLPLLLRDGHLIPLLDPTIDTLSQEDHPEVIGPSDVSDVYDVVGFVSMETGGASFELWDGGTLSVSWAGGLDLSALAEASGDEDLGRCQGCFLLEELEGGLLRLRVSLTDGRVEAGGLTLDAQTQRKTRWDLYLGQ